jgi:predicted MPP superfamily phosphohydrolase
MAAARRLRQKSLGIGAVVKRLQCNDFDAYPLLSLVVLIAHLSDLHVRDASDVRATARLLDGIVRHRPDHLAITGDLLDRWEPVLLEQLLDALDAHGLLDPARVTILHGNHDLASSGGHPRRTADLWRLVLRFWDPPPLISARKRRFYEAIERRGWPPLEARS